MKITIIGCGNMGGAIAERLSQTHQLLLYNDPIAKAEHLAQKGWGEVCRDIEEALHTSEMVILAVKPQNLKQVATLIKDKLQENQMVVSILAGTPIEALRRCFRGACIVRMMPNLALMYGEGIIGLCGKTLQKEDEKNLTKTFETLGKIYWLTEEKMDAITALASSGPAFFFTIIEAMIDAGVAMGFASQDARSLVYQMLQGSLTLLEKTDESPGELIRRIASPGGMTVAGLKKLEELDLKKSVLATFLAAYDHAKKLSSLQDENAR